MSWSHQTGYQSVSIYMCRTRASALQTFPSKLSSSFDVQSCYRITSLRCMCGRGRSVHTSSIAPSQRLTGLYFPCSEKVSSAPMSNMFKLRYMQDLLPVWRSELRRWPWNDDDRDPGTIQ